MSGMDIGCLEWQPEKRGAKFVSVPMTPQLVKALTDMTVIGPRYILNKQGRPITSADGMS